ncbi:MAG: S-layer homology domain-containing protein, partial [Firmicutes bacterium]|nr:S-layer homology domain-containing protein [Bacillota bacterium]
MKKVLSFVLVLSMILGSFGMAFAAPADVEGKDYEDAVNVLVELGVVAGYKDGTFRPENIVTRAEMATFLIKAMGLADYAVAKSEFSDMAGHWADPFVAYAASLGIVAGYADGTFKPDVTVSYDQAITMVIQALGYKGEYLVGGFPGAFVNQAKALGILKDVKAGVAGANRGDIATLLYNALPKAFQRYDNEGAIQPAGGSMMTRLGAEFVDAEFVVVGDEDAAINLKEYQGASVKAWYNEDEEIIAVEVQSVFVEAEYDAEDEVFVVGDKEYKVDRVLEDEDGDDIVIKMFRNGDADGTATVKSLLVDEAEY